MSKIRITKQFDFEMAHALYGHDGLCATVHGHSYRLFVCICGEPLRKKNHPKNGMVMDFLDLKQIVHKAIIQPFDHALVLSSHADKTAIETLKQYYNKIIVVDYQPTSELMIEDFAQRIQSELPARVQLYSLRLCETATSSVEWIVE
jgi:6-pyruvoyltetrahydropterin/6-carboxytetrahydropterin synthase